MPFARHRLLILTLACCAAPLLGLPGEAVAQQAAPVAAAKPAAKPAAAKPTARPARANRKSRDAADDQPPATTPVELVSDLQLGVAARVLTGEADCEFNQHVTVVPLQGVPGYFTVTHLRKQYRMLPRETSTGVVRLEDPDAGIVWLQIPAKSMLMNTRIGQRIIDNCMHSEQRAAINAVAAAANSLGIVAPAASSAAASASAAAPAAPVATAASAAPVATAASAAPVAAAASAATVAAAASAPPVAGAASAPPIAGAASEMASAPRVGKAAPAATAASGAAAAAPAAVAQAAASAPASR